MGVLRALAMPPDVFSDWPPKMALAAAMRSRGDDNDPRELLLLSAYATGECKKTKKKNGGFLECIERNKKKK